MHRQILVARARVQGFLILDHQERYPEAVSQLAEWVRAGRIKYQEHILPGIEHAPGAIDMLYTGRNEGKLLVKV